MMKQSIWENEEGVFVRVIVKPHSKQERLIEDYGEEEILINLNSPAREGKANKELIKRFSRLLGVSSADISLVAGHKGREKTLFIAEMTREKIDTFLRQAHKC
jgi:uncharacterized protein (TIGR00251 family)